MKYFLLVFFSFAQVALAQSEERLIIQVQNGSAHKLKAKVYYSNGTWDSRICNINSHSVTDCSYPNPSQADRRMSLIEVRYNNVVRNISVDYCEKIRVITAKNRASDGNAEIDSYCWSE